MIVWRGGRTRTVCDGCHALAPEPVPADWNLERRVLHTVPATRVDEEGRDVFTVTLSPGPPSPDDDGRRPTVVAVASCPDCQGNG